MSVQVSAQHRRFGVPFNTQLANLIPGSIETEFDGDKYVVVPHTTDTTRIARNLGYKVPAPLTSRYDWAGDTPFRTQRITAAMLTMNKRAFVLSQMGTGKTRAALHALNFLLAERAITSALIAAPLSTLTLVWDREIFEFFPHLNVSVLYGTKAQRLDALKKPADIYIINHDGVEVIREALVARKDIGCVIIDEVAAYRNQQTARWKTMQQVVYDRGYVWGLTGSPTPNEPTDAYGQVKLFMPHKVPRHFSHFRKSTMRQITQFKWIAKEDANDTVFELMQPAVRFRRDECVELPPVSYVGRQAAMSKVQEKVYKALVRSCA
ncbi:MAG: DEAD/DEAH box helicase [Aquincola sp.]|nr:DEAD/DEAH box helicase [Aquincola sp.]